MEPWPRPEVWPGGTNASDVERALEFAARAHLGQRRKYTGEPYVFHCVDVASIVATVEHDDAMLCAALLHDTLEDTSVSVGHLQDMFGADVTQIVLQLTDVSKPSDGNRAVRKAIDRAHMVKATPRAQTIKFADFISNTQSIVARDPGFAKVYLSEKAACLALMHHGDASLRDRALSMLPASV